MLQLGGGQFQCVENEEERREDSKERKKKKEIRKNVNYELNVYEYETCFNI